jgi:UDP-N-acetylmuramoyl-L-alanyl-D-glutamate--2,6-diaminopimelate ligase
LKIKDILEGFPLKEIIGGADVEITAVTYDSRQVGPGALFVAIKGLRADGHDFVADAVARGAAAVVVEKASKAAGSVPQLVVEDSRRALAAAAAAFFGHPGRELSVVGVTGTNGKTTACFLLDAVFRAAGKTTALATTVKNVVAGVERPARLTTAEAPEVQALLREAVAAGADVAVVEVSSHALALSRVAGTPFAAAVFTNLSHDHLDLHGDMASYFAAKASLFEGLAEGAPAVINVDDPFGRDLAASLARPKVVAYGTSEGCDYRVTAASSGWEGLSFAIAGPEGTTVEVSSPLRGSFNVLNCAAAFAAARELGAPADAVVRGIAAMPAVPGRLETVDVDETLRVVVDYAHSPDSMEKALAEIRRITSGRVVVVFGCTGNRDVEKRPVMGELAMRYGDYVVLTTDDPYYEDPAAIARAAEAGIIAAGGSAPADYRVILDRGEAIRFALSAADENIPTIVAILGKGHEEVQKVEGREVPYNDRRTVEAAVAELDLRRTEPPDRAESGPDARL